MELLGSVQCHRGRLCTPSPSPDVARGPERPGLLQPLGDLLLPYITIPCSLPRSTCLTSQQPGRSHSAGAVLHRSPTTLGCSRGRTPSVAHEIVVAPGTFRQAWCGTVARRERTG